ncbi:MAG: TIM-barrel domain-containing protein [Bacteroidota bacterium]
MTHHTLSLWLRVRLLCVLLFLFNGLLLPQQRETPKYRQVGNSVVVQNARFQFLTPTLVRMEFSPSGHFTDAPTAVVVKRDWKKIKVDIAPQEGWIVATTGKLIVRYLPSSDKFTKENLRVSWNDVRGEHSWSLGDSDINNLGGISSSLDGASKKALPKFRPGILSRSGYFVLDDSRTPVWDKSSEWIVPRPEKENQDLYCFVYGQDYRHALTEYGELCGKIPMIPRYTLGAWITDLNYEYLPGTEVVDKYRFSEEDLKGTVQRFRESNIPLDIFVLDFAWHNYGWKGGYDWSPIFPNPKEFLDWAHRNGMKVTVNDHPGYGKESVLADEDSHAAEVRKELNKPLPPAPTFFMDIAKDWQFQTDPKDTGMQNKWSAREFNDSSWKTLQGGVLWEDQGFPDYDGFAWYRKWVVVPNEFPRPLLLIFGGVDDEYDLFINGEKVAHHGSRPDNSVYSRTTYTDISSSVRPGEKNLIAVRVNDWGGGGGLVRLPVALSDRKPAEGIRFNLADKHNAEVFMNVVHNPVIDQGVDFWWIDGGSGSCDMAGLNSQMWTNRVFYDYTERHTGVRAFQFSRYGGWGNHRYPSLFTGDTYSDWEVLAEQIPYTASGGNVLMPYVTHDIGGFLGEHVSFDLYARWVECGAFSPFLRLHSEFENPKDGNLRMPWTYGEQGMNLARKYFQLRYSLIPYIYTFCRVAHDSCVPLVRPLYLEHPALEKAYAYPGEYFFGDELLVVPVTDSTTEKDVYLPPGDWVNMFTDKIYKGDNVFHDTFPVDDIPVFVRAGSVIPKQPNRAYSDQKPLDTLVIDIYGSGSHTFNLYEDDGRSLDYRSGKSAWTSVSLSTLRSGESQIVVSPTKGTFKGQVTQRAYTFVLHAMPQPRSMKLNGRSLGAERKGGGSWSWDKNRSVAAVSVDAFTIKRPLKLTWK